MFHHNPIFNIETLVHGIESHQGTKLYASLLLLLILGKKIQNWMQAPNGLKVVFNVGVYKILCVET